MRSVGVMLMLCALAPLAHSYCYWGLKETGQQCVDPVDKTSHDIGEKWTNSKCHTCVCSSTDFSCCDDMGRVSGYPADCEAVYDWTHCTVSVHKIDDHTITCPHVRIGK
ncbi:hypothetical protein ACEWY4_027745 [Coilia grayii]|uniref:Beta-microseminoprotein n=1 Tax=Coilia grayii TaxID=363190 RepID=A0ABD1IPV9_9TELE